MATAHRLLSETLLSFSELAKRLPAHRGKGRCCPATIYRWVTMGIPLSTGKVLKLEAIRISGRWLTSSEALERFVDAQVADRLDSDVSPPAGTSSAERFTKRYATVDEAAEYSGLSVRTIRRLVSRGELRGMKPVDRVLIEIQQLDALIQRSSTAKERIRQ